MLQPLGVLPSERRGKQGQVDGEVRVGVGKFQHRAVNRHRHPQLLLAFPDQSLGFRLPRLYFASYKLPQQPPGLVGRPLAGQEFLPPQEEGRHHFYGHRRFPLPLWRIASAMAAISESSTAKVMSMGWSWAKRVMASSAISKASCLG